MDMESWWAERRRNDWGGAARRVTVPEDPASANSTSCSPTSGEKVGVHTEVTSLLFSRDSRHASLPTLGPRPSPFSLYPVPPLARGIWIPHYASFYKWQRHSHCTLRPRATTPGSTVCIPLELAKAIKSDGTGNRQPSDRPSLDLNSGHSSQQAWLSSMETPAQASGVWCQG